jgi:hypothetical protein
MSMSAFAARSDRTVDATIATSLCAGTTAASRMVRRPPGAGFRAPKKLPTRHNPRSRKSGVAKTAIMTASIEMKARSIYPLNFVLDFSILVVR